jgi:hypothetical protein
MAYKLLCSRPTQDHLKLMYKIIGADQKEYGPVSAEQLRQWVAEGRVNGLTMICPEGQTEWKPLSAFTEFAETLRTTPGLSPASPSGGSGGAPPEAILGRDYEVDIGGCITRSWDLVKQNFWPVVGTSLLILVISAVINQIIGLASGPTFRGIMLQRRVTPGGISIILATSVLGSPMYALLMAGLFKYYLKLIRAEGPTIGDAFAGFGPAAGQLIMLGLVSGLLTTIGYLLCVIPGIYLSVSWMFSIPLVIDRNMSFWDAMELSRKVVSKHWFILFALVLVLGLLAMSGIIACCVGVFVTMPIASVAVMYAYEDIIGRQGP